MIFHEDEEKDKEGGEVSEGALDEVLDENEDDEPNFLTEEPESEKDWA